MKLLSLAAFAVCTTASLHAQTGQQPPPFTAPQTHAPAATAAPGQSTPPDQQRPNVGPDTALPDPQRSTVPLRDDVPMATQPATPDAPSAALARTGGSRLPSLEQEAAHRRFLLGLGAYSPRTLPALPTGTGARITSHMRGGKLYLSLHDALALAIENNLAVEVTRYTLLAAGTEAKRAAGGGTLRSIDTSLIELPPGVGETSSPLLAVQGSTSNPVSTNAAVVDLSNVTQTGGSTTRTLGVNGSAGFSAGPSIPFFDPTLIGQAGFLRRSNTQSLIDATGASATGSTATGPFSFINAALDYQQGFSTGTQIDAFADNSPQVLYGTASSYNPFHSPSTSITVSQPLLRGFGRTVNLRFLRIARMERKESRAIFEQQLLETVYGISRLYYDLVSLGETIGVKELSLATAEKLYRDDKDQVEYGTLAPIELTRAQALLSSARLDLVQARGEYRQQEAILRQQLIRDLGQPFANIVGIVPTDTITVPQEQPSLDVSGLISDALTNRPDLAVASLQISADEAAVSASRNAVKPLLNAYANVQTRGSSLVPYTQIGSNGTAIATPNSAISAGGLRLSTIYQAGVQLNLPLRNRIAQADAERDSINLRQAQARSLSLQNEVRQQVENAAIALENAHQSYGAAVESRNYQQQLLQAEIDKFALGQSTNFLIVQDESYLAQARSTEVAARSNWMKARIALDRATGSLLDKNSVIVDEAISGTVR